MTMLGNHDRTRGQRGLVRPWMLWTAAAGVAVTYASLLDLRPDRPKDDATPPGVAAEAQPAADTSQLQAQLAALWRQVNRLTGDLQRVADERQGAPPAQVKPVQAAPPARTRQDESRIAKAQVSLLEQRIAEEAIDPAWSEAAQSQLDQVYAGQEFAGMTYSVQCRSTMCRMSFEVPASEEGMVTARKVSVMVPWVTQGYSTLDPATGRGVVYLAREGQSLPRADESASL